MTAFTQVFVQDSFARANQSGLGTASGGGTWTVGFGSPTLSIVSNEGKATGVNGNDWVIFLGGTITDTEVLVRISNSTISNNGMGIYVRYIDANNWYRVFLYGGSFAIAKKVAGTFTDSLAIVSASPASSTFYWIRIHIEASQLQAKYWSGTLGSEPPSYQLNLTDTSISSAGHVGLGAYHNVSADSSLFDSFTAYQSASNTTRLLATRFRLGATSLKSLATRLRLASASRPTQNISARLVLLSGTVQARVLAARLRLSAQRTASIATRFRLGSASTRGWATRLQLGNMSPRLLSGRMRLSAILARNTTTRVRLSASQVQMLSLRLMIIPGTVRPRAYVPSTVAEQLAQFQGTGTVLPILPPVQTYQINGTIIDEPVLCTAPQIVGTIVPAGSSFFLKWYFPSSDTQRLLQSGITVQMTFAIAGDIVTGPVTMQIQTIGFDVLAQITTLADIKMQRWIIPPTQFF